KYISEREFNTAALERAASIPKDTLRLAIAGHQKWPDKHTWPLMLVLNKYGGVEIDGWHIKADTETPFYQGHRRIETREEKYEEFSEHGKGGWFEYWIPFFKTDWEDIEFDHFLNQES
ncbi:MAG TPA: hypothetical protein PK643_00330, partial [Saprospiraceae bacterium]|nr:hypothetical protein [Saprospiraceae bacterium]